MDFLKNINEKNKILFENERKVIEYILKYEDIENIKIKNIEKDIYLSSSTVIRACKKLGYKTFNELKFNCIVYKNNLKNNIHDDFDVIKEKMNNEFNKILNFVNQDVLNDFIDIIKKSNKIFCIGFDRTSIIATELDRQLNSLGFLSSDYLKKYSIKDVDKIVEKDDLIILFSFNHEYEKYNEVFFNSKDKDAKIILINSKFIDIFENPFDLIINLKNTSKINTNVVLYFIITLIVRKINLDSINKKQAI